MRPTILASLLIPLLTGILHAQAPVAPVPTGPDIQSDGKGYYIIQFDEVEGERLEDFIDLAKNLLLLPIKYNPQEIADTKIRIIGAQRIKSESFYQYFQAVLKSYEFIIVPMGPEDGSFLSIQRVQGGAQARAVLAAKALAPVVDVSELSKYRRDAATLITTSIPLQYIEARGVVSTFQQLVDNTIETVRNVENANSLVVTGFGQHVWGVFQLSQLIDVPPLKIQPTIIKRELHHAAVDELVNVLTELLSAARGLRAGQATPTAQAGLSMREIEPRVIAEPRSNSLLIAGSDEMVARIESWVDVLDVEVDPRGNTHVYRLKNTNAEDLAQVLSEVINAERSNQSGGRAGSASVSGGGAGGGLEVQSSVVADSVSNSLVITASERKYSEMVELVRILDVRPRQVLIEAAIVETSNTLNESFSVGLSGGDLDDGTFVSNFGTPLGFNDTGAEDLLGTLGVTSGGQFSVYSGADLPIPFLLQVLSADSHNNVLSRPYLLTNDNQEATISSQRETSFQTFTTTNQTTNQGFEQVSAGISLSVSPTISAGNYLRLSVVIEVSDFAPPGSGIPGAPPDITTRNLETPVTLPDGHTVVLGGLVSEDASETVSKFPWLGDLPGIGWMFRSESENSEKRYLYVFITPHIIDTDFALLDEISDLRKRELSRLGGDISKLALELPGVGRSGDVLTLGSEELSRVFAMPAPALPGAGEMDASAAGAGAQHGAGQPADDLGGSNGLPGFDQVFGLDAGGR